jgi:hypothetical protein
VSAVPVWPVSLRLIHRKDAKNAKKFFNEKILKTLRSLRLCGENGVYAWTKNRPGQ